MDVGRGSPLAGGGPSTRRLVADGARNDVSLRAPSLRRKSRPRTVCVIP